MSNETTTIERYCEGLRVLVETQPSSFMAQWYHAISAWHEEQLRTEREMLERTNE